MEGEALKTSPSTMEEPVASNSEPATRTNIADEDKYTFSWDFLGTEDDIVQGQYPDDKALIMALKEDVLNIFLGIDGELIKANPIVKDDDKRTFRISDQVPMPLIHQLSKLIPAASDFSGVVRFVEECSTTSAGRVNEALAAAFSDELHQFMHSVVSLEKEKILDLNRIWYCLQEDFLKLNVMMQISGFIRKEKSRGGSTLSVLHGCSASCITDLAAQLLCVRWLQEAARPFFESLTLWLQKGEIYDPYDEFMITERRDGDVSLIINWEKKFELRIQYIPSFLEKIAPLILETGKYMFCLRMSSCFVEMPHCKFDYDCTNLNYLDVIKECHQSGNNLLKLLLNYDDLTIRKLEFAKSLFCIENGDFFYSMIELCGEELEKPMNKNVIPFIAKQIESSIKNSSLGQRNFSNEIEVLFEKVSLTCQVTSLLNVSFSAVLRGEFCVVEAISLNLKVTWPLKIFLDTTTIKCYQMIFRHIFYAKFVFYKLCQVGQRHANDYHFLRYRMIVFMQTYLSFIAIDTIETSWDRFRTNYSCSSTVKDMIDEHKIYIFNILSGCMLSSLEMHQCLYNVFNVCLKFSRKPSLDCEGEFLLSLNDLTLATGAESNWSRFSKTLSLIFKKNRGESLNNTELTRLKM